MTAAQDDPSLAPWLQHTNSSMPLAIKDNDFDPLNVAHELLDRVAIAGTLPRQGWTRVT